MYATNKESRLYFLVFIVIFLFAESFIIYKETSSYLFGGTLIPGEYRKETALFKDYNDSHERIMRADLVAIGNTKKDFDMVCFL